MLVTGYKCLACIRLPLSLEPPAGTPVLDISLSKPQAFSTNQQATPNYRVSVTFLNVHPQGNLQQVCSLSSQSTSSPLLELLFHKGWTHLTSSQACFSTPYFTSASEITWDTFLGKQKSPGCPSDPWNQPTYRHMLQKTEFHSGS